MVSKQRKHVVHPTSHTVNNHGKRDGDSQRRASQVTRTVDLDSSIIPRDTNGVDVPEIAGILRLNSHPRNEPPSPSTNPRFLSRCCERNERGRGDRNTRDSLPCLPSF